MKASTFFLGAFGLCLLVLTGFMPVAVTALVAYGPEWLQSHGPNGQTWNLGLISTVVLLMGLMACAGFCCLNAAASKD